MMEDCQGLRDALFESNANDGRFKSKKIAAKRGASKGSTVEPLFLMI